MKKLFCLIFSIAFLIISCKNKKNKEDVETSFFPVLSYINSQVAHVDTSVYRIIKIVQMDSIADTTFLKREEFKEAAKDFLNIPDISSGKLKNEYTETRLFDEDLGQAILNYMPKNHDKEIIRQEVMIKPGPEGDKVRSIFIDRITNEKDNTIHKILFWQVDRRFRTVTIIKAADAPEKKETVEVIWNDYPSQ